MLWGKSKEETPAPAPAPAPGEPIKRGRLSPQMQKIVDRDDHFYDDVYTPYSVDSTDTPYRYAGYANRLRTLLLSAHRYVAYTSDIGESFRPVAHPYLVRSAYAVSWSYLIGDVAHEGYKAYLRNRRVLAPPCEAYKDASDLSSQQVLMGMATGNVAGPLSGSVSAKEVQDGDETLSGTGKDTLTPWPSTHIPLIEDYRVVMAKRAVFQSVASMGLPAFTIHSVVRYSGRWLKGAKSSLARTWVPIGLGLSIVPFLPYIFDHPVDLAVEQLFRTGLYIYGGVDAVRPLPKHSEVAGTKAHGEKEQDPTSLRHFHIKVQEGESTVNGDVTWDEYKQELQKAKERRKKEREENGGGVLAMLGFGSKGKGDGKDKTE
ncbi:mitochondrial 18 KDa protein-domain-containing protein [Aspergillus karnatakaensis]|uniref:mitochondrial fission process 1 family protein n=1 Tax=Aspergillus karnatakaensis TaxID=1810916 RepID=UPI003CCD6A7E